MKRNWGMVIAIVLLLAWAIGASVAFVKESDRSLDLIFENNRLEDQNEALEKAYAKLEAEYEALEEESGLTEAKYTQALAYEWLLDVLINTSGKTYNPNYDADAALDAIIERENLSQIDRISIAFLARDILSRYGIKTN